MRSVLITGGTGAVGSNLAAALSSRTIHVRLHHRPTSDLRAVSDIHADHMTGDIRDRESVLRAVEGCDTVFHAAAMVSHAAHDRALVQEINVIGTRNIVEACLAAGVRRLVHVSSVAAIGSPKNEEPADEETPFTWKGPPGYKLSKYYAEREIAEGIARGLDAVMVNPSVIVGERDIHFHGGQLIRAARRGLLRFSVPGGMNIVYAGDVVRGMILAAEKGKAGERYVLCGENLTHTEIFTRTARIVGGPAPLATLPLPLLHAAARAVESICTLLGITPWVTADLVANAGSYNWFRCEKAKRELGYTVTPFDDAIRAAFDWYRRNGLL